MSSSLVARRLLIRPGAIGDCILALPELEANRADYTEVWAPRPVLPLIESNEPQFADRTRAIPDTGLDLLGIVQGPRTTACLRDLETFDSIYSWYGSNHPEFREAVRHLPFTFFPAQPINVIGTPRIQVPPRPVENFAVIHPFSSSAKKNWPLDSFRETSANLKMPVKWCVGPEEHLDDALDQPVRIDNLYDLACWLSTARVYIGNDSGITHLAAAVGVATIAVFTTTDPRVWAPRGDHVTILDNPSVDDVLAAASGAGPRSAG
jgi:heptosyltransferase-3